MDQATYQAKYRKLFDKYEKKFEIEFTNAPGIYMTPAQAADLFARWRLEMLIERERESAKCDDPDRVN